MLRLTLEREKRGWSRAELGRRAGIHPADVGRLESGKLYPYPGWRKKLAKALDVAEDLLFEAVAVDGR